MIIHHLLLGTKMLIVVVVLYCSCNRMIYKLFTDYNQYTMHIRKFDKVNKHELKYKTKHQITLTN